MSSYLDKYNTRNSAYGNGVSGTYINSAKTIIGDKFYNSPSYYQVQITSTSSSTPVSPVLVDSWIVDDSQTKELKQIQLYPGVTLNYGDLVLWNGDFWLTLLVDNMGGIYFRGSIQKCYSSLKWLDSTSATPTKEAYFTLITDTQRGLGVSDGRLMILPDERRYVAIQKNTDTLKIFKGQRFILDNNRAWRVLSINTLFTGLIHLELQEDEIKSTDNVSLRIADYTQTTIPPTQPDGSKTLI